MEFYYYWESPKLILEDFDPVDFLLREDKTGIYVLGILGNDPFAVNYGNYSDQTGNPPYRAFQIEGKTYTIEGDDSIVLARAKRNPFFDIDKIPEKVVMLGNKQELLDAFLSRGYRLKG